MIIAEARQRTEGCLSSSEGRILVAILGHRHPMSRYDSYHEIVHEDLIYELSI